jgi:hypothetical protein
MIKVSNNRAYKHTFWNADIVTHEVKRIKNKLRMTMLEDVTGDIFPALYRKQLNLVTKHPRKYKKWLAEKQANPEHKIIKSE